MIRFRVLSQILEQTIRDKMKGRLPSDDEYDTLITGAAQVALPNGKPLLTYVPNSLRISDNERAILSAIKKQTSPTINRKPASGSRPVYKKNFLQGNKIASATIGWMDKKQGAQPDDAPNCRLTSWTGKHASSFKQLLPLFDQVSQLFQKHVPNRFATQLAYTMQTPKQYRIGNTPFSTMTVNNSFPTGIHKDKGDLEVGFSCLAVFRQGDFDGGRLVFPSCRLAVDMQDCDLILMDAHQWHGNTKLIGKSENWERVSLVLYYRTFMYECANENLRPIA